MLDYKVIASGSKGNCVAIENVMVDCGVPFKKIKDVLYDIDVLLITHRHSDHISLSTYKHIRKDFPNITVITNEDVSDLLEGDVDEIINIREPVEAFGYEFHAFNCVHDVMAYGYYWRWENEETGETADIIYATDTRDFRFAPREMKFDYLFLESNHDERKLNAIKHNARRQFGYDAYAGGKRHASTQICKGYYYMHRRDKDSELIELHKSERFY